MQISYILTLGIFPYGSNIPIIPAIGLRVLTYSNFQSGIKWDSMIEWFFMDVAIEFLGLVEALMESKSWSRKFVFQSFLGVTLPYKNLGSEYPSHDLMSQRIAWQL